MAPVYSRSNRSVDKLLDDHSSEGIAILLAEPSRLIRGTIVVMLVMLVSAVVWSFFGRMDVIVTGVGTIKPESRERNVFVPIKGRLVDVCPAIS